MAALLANLKDTRQARFVQELARGRKPDDAALASGYRDSDACYRLLRLPHIMEAVHQEVQRLLVSEEAPASLAVLRMLREDTATPPRVRADIGLQLMKMAGHVAPSHQADKPAKQFSEMTQAELLDYIDRNQAEIERSEAELAARAKDVSAPNGPVEAPNADTKSLQFLD